MPDDSIKSPSTQPIKMKPLWPTLLDYGILIGLAVVTAFFTVYFLTLDQPQIVTKPNPKLEAVLKS